LRYITVGLVAISSAGSVRSSQKDWHFRDPGSVNPESRDWKTSPGIAIPNHQCRTSPVANYPHYLLYYLLQKFTFRLCIFTRHF